MVKESARLEQGARSCRPSVLATCLAVQLKPALTLVVICYCRGLSLLKPNIFSTSLHPLPREGMIMRLIQNMYTQIKPLISKLPSGCLGQAVLMLLPLQMPAQAEPHRAGDVLVASRDLPRCGSWGWCCHQVCPGTCWARHVAAVNHLQSCCWLRSWREQRGILNSLCCIQQLTWRGVGGLTRLIFQKLCAGM